MAASYEELVKQSLGENAIPIVELNLGLAKLKSSELEFIVNSLDDAHITRLKLSNMNYFEKKIPLKNKKSLILLAMEKVVKNPFIESLELGPEFLSIVQQQKGAMFGIIVDFKILSKMSNLKCLILDNVNWNPSSFETLQAYLTDPQCKLKSLYIKRGLNAKQIECLEKTLASSTSLEIYHGAAEKTLNKSLNEKFGIGSEQPPAMHLQ